MYHNLFHSCIQYDISARSSEIEYNYCLVLVFLTFLLLFSLKFFSSTSEHLPISAFLHPPVPPGALITGTNYCYYNTTTDLYLLLLLFLGLFCSPLFHEVFPPEWHVRILIIIIRRVVLNHSSLLFLLLVCPTVSLDIQLYLA